MKSIVAIAKKIVNDEESILSGSQKLWSLWCEVSDDHWADEDFRIFGVIDSDTDDLLLSTDRSLWNKESIIERDAEIEKRESFYREEVLMSCKRITQKYS